ncbi:DUF4062 domain-containing protein [Pseudoflavonifractor sp. An85]|uniref:DUF4062 domain-containing protein n=1 Tax=Pseudoflavonifractor sp. An85 TaxID=1965661 RepID=UPI001302C37B|nr:DUF4062 domain-containing protein [Pseudoflavonifractor sp. An85]
MAAPRVFISSTYYDLRQVRNNIGNFLEGLGYEIVMHERSGVAYTQNQDLEIDCYQELSSCDIVVCIIGNHFGTASASNDELSITMHEIQAAIRNKKKVYVFISHDVSIENRTYALNKDNENFKSAYTDNPKIHEFILELKSEVKNHPILDFGTTDDIISVLKSQFAGLFQNLLAREASLTEAQTVYNLQASVEQMKQMMNDFSIQHDDFFRKFNGTILASNRVVNRISKHLGLGRAVLFAENINALDDFMTAMKFESQEVDDTQDIRKYVRNEIFSRSTLVLKNYLFEENGRIKDVRSKTELNEGIVWKYEDELENELPF